MDNLEVSLHQVATITMGTSPRGTTYNHEGLGLPLLNGPTEFGEVHPHCTLYTTDSKKECKAGDLIFCVRASTGRMNWADQLYSLGRGVCSIRGETPLDTKYIRYCIEWKLKSLLNLAGGSTYSNLTKDMIRDFPIPYLDSRYKIAAVLSAYDNLIENNTRRIKILEEMAQAIYREWFVEFRFPGHEGVEMVDSELGLIPHGWDVKQLGEMCHVIMGLSPKSEFYNETGDGLPFHQGVTDFGERFPTDRVYCTIPKRIAKIDDILFSVRAPVGRINIANKKIVIGRGLSAIRSKTGNQAFVLQQLKDRFQEEDTMGSGSIFNAIRKSDLLGIPLLIPTESLVAKFEEIANSIFAGLANLNQKNINLRQTRDLLLPKLIPGEIDVAKLDIRIDGMQPRKGGAHIPSALADLLHSDEGILGGKPVIRGTRLAVDLILELLAHEWSEERIIQNYPTILPEHIAACLAYQQEVTDASVSR